MHGPQVESRVRVNDGQRRSYVKYPLPKYLKW